MAEKSHMPYLVIVVLVAVVAVVVLVLNARPSSEEAVAGEAVSLVPSLTLVKYSPASGGTKTGNEVCKSIGGYRGCASGVTESSVQYYDMENCVNSVLNVKETNLVPCEKIVEPVWTSCSSLGGAYVFRSTRSISGISGALCYK